MSTANQRSDAWAVGNIATLPQRMSEAQFERWAFANPDLRAEWVDGELAMMSPVSFDHAAMNVWLSSVLSGFAAEKNLGVVVGPEFMVRLRDGKSRRVPDLLFVTESRRTLIRPTYLDGPPDLAIEIVSCDSQARDYREKYLEYEAAGVREYWIVDPFSKHIEAYSLGDDGKFVRIDEAEGKIASTVLEGFYLRNEWLWAAPRPTAMSLLKEMGIA